MKIAKLKLNKIRLLRAASQILFFIFLPALYVGAFDGIKEIYLGVYGHDFSLTALLPQTVEAIAIIPVTLLLGRFFCGWMCAFGAMGDFISMLSKRIFKRRFKIDEKTDKALKSVKYIWLVFLIVVVWSLGSKAFGTSNPWDAFGMLLTPGSLPDFSYVAAHLALALVFLLLIIVGSFFVERFFCRYLCPLGAVFSVISKLRVTSIRKPREKCGKCRICTNSCPMGVALYQKDSVRSGDCIDCFECTAACPRKNVGFALKKGDVRPVVAGTMAVAVMTGVYYAGSFEASALAAGPAAVSAVSGGASSSIGNTVHGSEAGGQSAPASSAAPSAAKYRDGTYEGSGMGYRGGTTTVSVTVRGGKITDVEVVSTGDSPRFFDRAYPVVTQSILGSQTSQVDAVSGATYSSNGIMQAVADALTKASA